MSTRSDTLYEHDDSSYAAYGIYGQSAVVETQSVRRILEGELSELKATLHEVRTQILSGEQDLVKGGALVARLCDSIGRLMIAQQRVAPGSADIADMNDEWDRSLRARGLGEEEFEL